MISNSTLPNYTDSSRLLILNHPDSMKTLANWYGIKNGARNKLIESLHSM